MAAEAEIFSSRTRGRVRVPLSSVDFNLVRTEFLGTPFKAEVNNGDYEKGNVISITKKRRSRAHRKHDIYTPLVFNDSTNIRRLNGAVDSTLSSYGETFKSFEGATVNFETAFKEKSRNSSGVPVASLGNPQQHIVLNFGYSNFVGKTRSLPLRIVATSSNNTLDSEYPIELDPTPLTKGFEIVLGGDYALKHKHIVCDGKSSGDRDAPTIFYLKQAESRVIHVVWTPTQEGEIREETNLVSPLGRIQITLLGIACDTVKKSTLAKMKSQPRRDLTTFHARDNITYDSQRWEDRQCATFTTWLNDVFHPESVFNRVDVEHILVEWETAKKLFDSPKMQAIRCSVEREVKHGRLAITPRSDEGHLATTPGSDRNILDEVHVREQLTKLLLSYTPRWLQLGLGIVLAMNDSELIRANHCMSKGSLNKVIIERVLTEPSGVRKYSSRCKTMSWKFECKNRIAIHQHALSQIMILVYFLDSAKRNRVLTEDPCLFDTSSSMKSSEEVLISLCQDCFSIPGSTIKHLNYEGISVCHVQNALDEFDFHVKNLAVDLKDGVCIAKLIETVTNTSNILALMRVPATTRQHKIYNVNVVLTALRHLGVPNISDITTAHIVAAHQPRTLQLLWSTIIYFDLPQFELEIVQYKASRLIQGYVRRFLGTRSYHLARHGTISFQSAYRGFVVRTRVGEIKNVILIQKIWRGYRMKLAYRFNLFGILAIQRFCRRVIARNQFHMQGAAIKIQKSWRGHRCMISFGCDLMGIITIQSICRCFIAKNLVHRIVRETNAAGNIQRVWRGYCTKMKFGSDMMDIVTVESFCRRFVALNRAMKKSNTIDIASINIQRVWRGYNAKLSYGFNLMDIITVQSICRQFIARKKMFRNNACVLKIQSSIRMWAVRKCYSKFREAAFTIQRYVRSVLASSHDCYLKTHIVHMQRVIRGWLCRKQISVPIMITSFEFGGVSTFPATTLHPHTDAESFKIISTPTSQGVGHLPPRFSLTAKILGNQLSPMLRNSIRETEEAYSYPKNAAIEKSTTSANKGKEAPGVPSISNIEIDYFTCKTPESSCSLECSSPHDADEISFTTRHASRKPIFGAIGKIAKLVHDTDQVVKRITSQDVEPNIIFDVSGSLKETENLCNEPSANKELAIEVDSLSTHRTYQSKHAAAIAGALIIQAQTNNRGNSAVEIQKLYRGFVARNQFIFTKFAPVLIQSAFRRHLCEINYRCLRKSAILAQALYRGRKARQKWVKIALQRNIIYAAMSLQRLESFAAAQIQRIWKGYMANVNFILLILATIKIQSSARRHITAAKFCEMLERRNSAALTLQRAVRVFIASKTARNSRNRRGNAAVVIQKVHRGFVARNQFIFTKFAAVLIQSAFRRHLCEINYRCLRKSAILAQALYRGRKARQKWVKIALQRNIIYAAMSLQRSESFAVTQIQRIWRGYMANTDFILLILATIKIQSLARRHIAATKYRYLRMCVIYAQANCRGVIVMQHASVGREQLERARIITAVTTLQRAVRGMIDRVQVNVEVFAATEIQRSWRGYRSNANFMLTVMSAIKIQTFTRFVLAKAKLARLEKERSAAEAEYDRIELERILAEQRKNKLTHTSLPILKALSASSRTTQSLHAEAELFKLKNTVTSQCVGQMTTRFSLLPASVHAAMEPAEGVFRLPNGITQSSKFESLTAKAIRTLQKRKKFSEVLKAVMVMEKITSQSMYECRVIIDANAHEELISIICSCNRSSPHLELIRLILSVLRNLSQHPHLLSRLASDKTINTLTDVVHMFRDKPTPFVVASSLLERMLRGNHHLVPKYSKSENKKLLCSIVSLCKEKVSKLGDTKKGIRCLENIILICECELQTHLK